MGSTEQTRADLAVEAALEAAFKAMVMVNNGHSEAAALRALARRQIAAAAESMGFFMGHDLRGEAA